MKKRRVFIAIVLVFSFVISGCVSAVELSEKESSIIADYSSYVMIQHSRYRDNYLYSKTELQDLKEEISEKPEKETEEKPEYIPEEKSDVPSDTKEATENLANTDKPLNVHKEYVKHSDALGISGVDISYDGYEVKEAYVLDYFALNAAKGNNLIIMKFVIKNNTNENLDIDISKISPEYIVTVNNSSSIKAMSTILLNDLSSYKTSLAGRESKNVVLIFEAAASILSSVDSIDLAVKVNGNSSYIEL